MTACQDFWNSFAPSPAREPSPPALAAAPRGGATQAALADAEATGANGPVEEMCLLCQNKWLLITITRHTKVNFTKTGTRTQNGQRVPYTYEEWDATLGDLKMEVFDTATANSGSLVFQCHTVERHARGGVAQQKATGASRMVVAQDVTSANIHAGSNIKTYNYVTQNDAHNQKPRAGIGVFGNGLSMVSSTRAGVCFHHASSHLWSEGCILLTGEVGAKSDGKWRFGVAQSYTTLMSFREKVLTFGGHPTGRAPANAPGARKLDRTRVRIIETFA